jgi:hypothetical protein
VAGHGWGGPGAASSCAAGLDSSSSFAAVAEVSSALAAVAASFAHQDASDPVVAASFDLVVVEASSVSASAFPCAAGSVVAWASHIQGQRGV